MLVLLLLEGYSVYVRPEVELEQAPKNTISPKPYQKKEPYWGEGLNIIKLIMDVTMKEKASTPQKYD